MTTLTFTCERCGCVFERKAGHKYQYCSQSCASQRGRKIGKADLAEAIKGGGTAQSLAKRFGVGVIALREALRAYGLYQTWSKSRYRKCASPMAGSTSATTASGGATSRSAESVSLTVGGTSCGG